MPFSTLLVDGKDINAAFIETSNYYKELTLFDFDLKDGMLENVHYQTIKCNKELFV